MIEGFLTYLRSEKRYSELTVRAYGDDIRQFVLFCCGVTAPPTPEEEADILRSTPRSPRAMTCAAGSCT